MQAVRWTTGDMLIRFGPIHDLGLMPSRFLAEREEIKAGAEIEVLKLASRVYDAAEYAVNRENKVEARIRLEQAPVREYMAELERLKRQKAKGNCRAVANTRVGRYPVFGVGPGDESL